MSKRALALALIRMTRHQLEQERQPAILDTASVYFRMLTAGRYEALSADWQGRMIHALRQGEQVEPARLSRGTAEQLLLAMRFALAEERARSHQLPLLMDDILVNFDDRRSELALQAIGELSKHQQIMMFTCHKTIHDAAQATLAQYGLQTISFDVE